MAFSNQGAITAETISTGDPIFLPITSAVAAGDIVLLAAATDDLSRTVTSVTDSNGHAYTVIGSGVSTSGAAILAYAVASSGLTTSNQITLNWSSSTDTIARAWALRGLTEPNVGSGTTGYTESTTYSQSVTSSEDGVQVVCFGFPFDYLFGGVSISGWTKLAEIDDTPDQSMQAYYKEVTAGSNTCTKTVGTTVAYIAAGVVLPYLPEAIEARQQVIVVM